LAIAASPASAASRPSASALFAAFTFEALRERLNRLGSVTRPVNNDQTSAIAAPTNRIANIAQTSSNS